MSEYDLAQAEREEARWRVLIGLDVGGYRPVSETILYRLLHDVSVPLTPHELRVQLDYLEDRGLIQINDKDGEVWSAELTRDGRDVVEYTVSCEPGIARPPKNR